ncbi:PREDICTED: translation initiation factor IF-2-like [Chinchilla lanigera]|uniref:translation initiation factor IF-2-like n=1 Tax=Chinchilla lanigera TaxID=34839 RepID=UPI0006970745|nr:PREDICTED: translation initiation factor IF-2-like [Chinchilla lanigera]
MLATPPAGAQPHGEPQSPAAAALGTERGGAGKKTGGPNTPRLAFFRGSRCRPATSPACPHPAPGAEAGRRSSFARKRPGERKGERRTGAEEAPGPDGRAVNEPTQGECRICSRQQLVARHGAGAEPAARDGPPRSSPAPLQRMELRTPKAGPAGGGETAAPSCSFPGDVRPALFHCSFLLPC